MTDFYVAYNETSGLIVGLFGSHNTHEGMKQKIEQARMPLYIRPKRIVEQSKLEVSQ